MKTERYDDGGASSLYSTQTFAYTWHDNVKTQKIQRDSGEATYTFTYDYLVRRTKVTNPDSTFRTISYDDLNNIKIVKDEDLKEKRYGYDWRDRLIWTREYLNSTTIY